MNEEDIVWEEPPEMVKRSPRKEAMHNYPGRWLKYGEYSSHVGASKVVSDLKYWGFEATQRDRTVYARWLPKGEER